MNFYSHHLGDYSKATAHLSMLEDGAYRRMLDFYYSTEKPLPSDKSSLYRVLRARDKDEKSAVDSVLIEFFTLEEDGWHKARCDHEIEKAQIKRMKARESSGKRWHQE